MLQSIRSTYVFILFFLLGTVSTTYAADNDARVLSVSPSVASKYQGKSETLAPKMRIPVSATVVSDAGGRAQLMFPDTTTVSIAPGTEIVLAEFVDNPNEESIVLNMAQGTARFITGDVSRRKPSAMVVNTPQASIGIRGTMVTIVVSGDTTKVYLTETSGLGVTVTNRNTGKSMKMVKPGRLITVTPREMEDREGKLEEVRQMTADLHTRPRLTDAERRLPIGVANVTPTGAHGPAGAMKTDAPDATLPARSPRGAIEPSKPQSGLPPQETPEPQPEVPPQEPTPPAEPEPEVPIEDLPPVTPPVVGPSDVDIPVTPPTTEPDLSRYAGTFRSTGQEPNLSFTVNTSGAISGANATIILNDPTIVTFSADVPYMGTGGSGSVRDGGGFDISGFTRDDSPAFDSMSVNGQFNSSATGGDFTTTLTNGVNPYSERNLDGQLFGQPTLSGSKSGTFEKQ